MAYEYIVKGKVVSLSPNPKLVAVRFREPSDTAQRRVVIERTSEVGSFESRLEVPKEQFTVVPVAEIEGAAESAVTDAAFRALNAEPDVERVSPVFNVESRQVVAPSRLMVGFKADATEKAAEIVASEGGAIVKTMGNGNEYKVELPPNTDPFDVADRFRKHAEVEYAEPDFVMLGSHLARANADAQVSLPDEFALGAASPTDPFHTFKYAARKTQAELAWQRIDGSPSIKIAILDDGVDLQHPDLLDVIEDSFDALTGHSNQNPNHWDSHGTACAGLAGAVPRNGLGIRGMGNGCKLLAVRIAASPGPGEDWACTESNVVEGIDWAWMSGADVLSNSWGGGLASNAIINALERARQQGRFGKGCVVVVAAGNDSGAVSFPANEPGVLTVSASNHDDEPKTRASSDNETWWGSNFGPEVDLAAPGVLNFTTDITGAAGSNPGGDLDGNYLKNFNGTSSAAPIVAGIAGLVLSVNPALTETQVRLLLTQTADKVGQVVYTNGHNEHMGQGRVNALKAVQAAATFV